MKRSTAFELLGTTDRSVIAATLGVTRRTVERWPEVLPREVSDRVLAFCTRRDWEQDRRDFPDLKPHPLIVDALAYPISP